MVIKDLFFKKINYKNVKKAISYCYYHIDQEKASEFLKDIFIKVAKSYYFNIRIKSKSFLDQCNGFGFIYFGHGNKKGFFASTGFNYGIEKYLYSINDINKIDFSPLVIFACESAFILSKSGRQDWLGFNNKIGFCINGPESKWWKKYFEKLFFQILNARHFTNNKEEIFKFLKKIYISAIKPKSFDRKLSPFSRLFIRSISDSLELGDDFCKN